MGFSLSKALKDPMTYINPTVAANEALFGGGNDDQEQYDSAVSEAKSTLSSGYDTAEEQLKSGYEDAEESAKTGFQTARDTTTSGYGKNIDELKVSGQDAINTAKSGFDEAQSYYATPEMVASRTELYNRILGEGGYSDEALNRMKASAIEDYGTSLRDTEQSLSKFYGDSTAGGLAGENLARAAAELGADRANTIRDIDISNEQLASEEQTSAITQLAEITYQQAGLAEDEAKYISDLQMRLAEDVSSLTAQETSALTELAAQEGMTLADLQKSLGDGLSALSAEEATVLANLIVNAEANSIELGKSWGEKLLGL